MPHSAVPLPADTWTLAVPLDAGVLATLTNPNNAVMRVALVARGDDPPVDTNAPCDFLEPIQTEVYSDASDVDVYANPGSRGGAVFVRS